MPTELYHIWGNQSPHRPVLPRKLRPLLTFHNTHTSLLMFSLPSIHPHPSLNEMSIVSHVGCPVFNGLLIFFFTHHATLHQLKCQAINYGTSPFSHQFTPAMRLIIDLPSFPISTQKYKPFPCGVGYLGRWFVPLPRFRATKSTKTALPLNLLHIWPFPLYRYKMYHFYL